MPEKPCQWNDYAQYAFASKDNPYCRKLKKYCNSLGQEKKDVPVRRSIRKTASLKNPTEKGLEYYR